MKDEMNDEKIRFLVYKVCNITNFTNRSSQQTDYHNSQADTIDKTRNARQSLAYSPLGATVSPPSKTKPC